MDAVGVIGLGLMGGALAGRLLGGGRKVVGFDLREECRHRLGEAGGVPFRSVRAVFAAAPVIVLSLPTGEIVAEVLAKAGRLVAGKRIIDTTTGEPEATAALGERLSRLGADYLDATLTGSSRLAQIGELVVTAGGKTESFLESEPLFRLIAKQWFHVGPWGSGARTKLVVNLVLGLNRAVLAEGLAFAGRCGLDPAAILDVLRSGAAYSRAMDAKGPKMLAGDFSTEAKLAQHLKDVRLIRAAGERAGAILPLTALHEELLAGLVARGFGDLDNSAVFRAFDGERDMIHRVLGRTGLSVSAIAFGAGPVSGLMTGDDAELQRATVARAIAADVNWFDTAAGYGEGRSEENLGRVLAELGAAERVHAATKVRVPADAFGDVAGYVRRSLEASLRRLRLSRVTLLQLHNGITAHRGDEPASVSVADVLGPNGIAAALRRMRDDGLVGHIGLTGTGHPEALRAVVRSGEFDALQVPYNALNPSAGRAGGADGETDYGNVMADCAAMAMGVFAIRVYAGGALLEREPSAHTLKTPYFPLAVYRRDLERAALLRERIGGRMPLAELAIRFALSHEAVASAIVGFGSPDHVGEIERLPLDLDLPREFVE